MTAISKKATAFLLAVIMLMSLLPLSVMAAEATTLTFKVESVTAITGSSAQVKIELKHNPGVSSIKLKVSYDSSLALTSVQYNPEMGGQTLSPGSLTSPATLIWLNPFDNFSGDVTFATLTFKTPSNITESYTANVNVSYDEDDIYNMQENNVPCEAVNGGIMVFAGVPGDINGDGTCNNKDLTRFFQYLANWNVTVNEMATDTNGDGSVNMKDLTRLFQYLANWNVEIHYGLSAEHTHSITSVPAKAANCTEAGSAAYYKCTGCGKMFRDSGCQEEIGEDDISVPAKGHTAIIDEAVPATTTSTGLTEGSHCSVCNTVIVEQEIIPKLETKQYAINYNLTNGDTYLATLEINNPNPAFYTSEDGLKLKEISVPGYTFEGWYDGSSDKANRITNIAKGEKEEIDLYAHWTARSYKIQYDSDLIPVNDDTYTTNTGKVLPTPKLSGYTFVGWSDSKGDIIRRIPVGTTGDKVYSANWLSDRNQARTYKNVGDPIVMEEDNKILYTYEIGEIRNVPVSVIKDFGKIVDGGVAHEETVTHSKTVSLSEAQKYEKTVGNATTENYGITLSSGWEEGYEISEEWCREHGMTLEEAEQYCRNDTNSWYVSNGQSGSNSSTTFNTTDTTNMTTGTKNSSGTSGASTEVSASAKHTEENHSDFGFEEKIKAGGGIGPVSVEASVGASQSFGSSSEDETTNSSKNSLNSSVTVSDGNSHQSGTVTHTGSNSTSTSGWNTESGRSASQSVTSTQSTAKKLSEAISQKTGYGQSYINTGSESASQGFSAQQSSSVSYSTGITYSTEETETITETISTSNTIGGYHRWVWATTAHVFLVVGYDIATSSYFVCNFSILDDKLSRFEDYSYDTSTYDDNQTGVITFEIPTDIKEYVKERVAGSDGLQYSRDGKVTGYNGNDDFVIIPEYKVINGTVIKVTGISENAFKNKVKLQNGEDELLGIQLSDFITEIPDGAFYGCSSLKYIDFNNVNKIGSNAFAGCSSLKVVKLSDNITVLGSNAFNGIDALLVNAANKSIAEYAVNSGAKAIALVVSEKCADLKNTTLTIPAGTEYFGFYGAIYSPRTFTNLKIDSNAEETLIQNADFVSTGKAPVKIASSNIIWAESDVSASNFGIVLTAEHINLSVYGESTVSSNTSNAILTRDLSLAAINEELYSQFHLDGKIMIWGNIIENGLISFMSGKVEHISETEYTRYLAGTYTLTFDANGGSVSETQKTVYYGEVIGSLPSPTRTGYAFEGWYTAKTGGTKITSTTVSTFDANTTVYAHWNPNAYTATWNTVTGCTITVKRTSSPYAGAATGSLTSGATVYYGDILSITYTANTGYTLKTKGKTSITVTGNVTPSDIYATVTVNSYTASWSTGTGYTITVKRTSSPKAGAATGNLTSGATVNYSDVLSVTYTASTGYSIATHGKTSITVTGNVTASDIYATATPNNYTYTVKYVSVNGTNLGSDSVTKAFGTTNTITPPGKYGYITPPAQTVKWDSTSKTITFKYSIDNSGIGGSSSRGFVDTSVGTWATVNISYSIIGRTANSVTIRATCTMIKNKNIYTPYEYSFSCAGQDKEIIPFGAWNNYNNATATQTIDFTISAGTGRGSTNVSWSVPCRNYYGTVIDNEGYTDTVVYPAY